MKTGPGLKGHLGRLFGRATPISPAEKAALDKVGIWEKRLQDILVWRRSLLILVLPLVVVAVLLQLATTAQQTSGESAEILTGMGIFSEWVSWLAFALLPIGVTVAIVRWTDLRLSLRVPMWAWAWATVVPLVLALLPQSWMVDFSSLVGASQAESFNQVHALETSLLSTVTILPVVIGLAGGALRGARRAKALFPSSVLPGWFVVVVAPFYALALLAIFSVVSPVFNNGLFTTGVLCLVAGALVFVAFQRRFTSPMSRTEAGPALSRVSLIAMTLSTLGVLLIVVFAFTGKFLGIDVLGSPAAKDADEAFLSYLDLAEFGVGLAGRFYVTAIVMTLFFVTLIYREWRSTVAMSPEVKREHDAEVQSLSRLTSPKSGAGS